MIGQAQESGYYQASQGTHRTSGIGDFSPLALLHEFICAFEVTHSNAPPLFHLASGKWLISMALARSKASTSFRSVEGTHISTLPLQTSQKALNVEFRQCAWPDLHVELSGNASIDMLDALSTCRLYFWFIDFFTYHEPEVWLLLQPMISPNFINTSVNMLHSVFQMKTGGR